MKLLFIVFALFVLSGCAPDPAEYRHWLSVGKYACTEHNGLLALVVDSTGKMEITCQDGILVVVGP